MHVMIDIMILFASFENGLCLVLGELKEKANSQNIILKLCRVFLFKGKSRQHRSPELGWWPWKLFLHLVPSWDSQLPIQISFSRWRRERECNERSAKPFFHLWVSLSQPAWTYFTKKETNFPLLVQSVYLHPSKTQQHVISLWRQMDSFSSTTFMSFHSSAQKSESEAILKMQPVWSRAQIRQRNKIFLWQMNPSLPTTSVASHFIPPIWSQ